MNNDLKAYIGQWLTKAEHDLLNAQTVIVHNPLILDTACFHCQQAVEKYLKAFLVYNGAEIARTHNLFFLLGECAKYDNDFLNIEIKELNDFGVDIRYPDNFIMPSAEETNEYFQIAADIKALVLKKIEL